MNAIRFLLLLVCFIYFGCGSDNNTREQTVLNDDFIRAADLSFLPQINETTLQFKHNGLPQSMLETLKNSGVNTVRIRLWHTPATATSSFAEVKAFAQAIRQSGLKVWLTVHYSDSWADPGKQFKPAAWETLNYVALRDALVVYTTKIMNEIKPDIIQIGNETNDGFLWPTARITQNASNYIDLTSAASQAIRAANPKTKIMLHYAGLIGSDWYFNQVQTIDYDLIGLSYYPMYHAGGISQITATANALGTAYNKKVVIAETSYPFTFGFADNCNNIIGDSSQILPQYAATALGQRDFAFAVREAITDSAYGIGFAYWGGEWVAFNGPNAGSNGSPYENQAFYDFELNSLPVLQAFKKDLN